jgi:hypothetical protein
MEDSTWAGGGEGFVKRLPRESSILRGVHGGPVELSCLSHFCSFLSLFFLLSFSPNGIRFGLFSDGFFSPLQLSLAFLLNPRPRSKEQVLLDDQHKMEK